MDQMIFPPRETKDGRANSTRIQMTYASILDYMVANPSATIREVAAHFNYSPQGISIITNSDSFKAAYHIRKEEILDPVLMASVEERLQGIAHQSAERVAETLATSTNGDYALKALDTVSRALGYGVAKPVSIENNFVVALPGPAASTHEWSSRFAAPGATVLRPNLETIPSETKA